MKTKVIKLSPKKNGKGYITSYTLNIGSAEARECEFVDADNNMLPIEKIIDTTNRQIIIKLKED